MAILKMSAQELVARFGDEAIDQVEIACAELGGAPHRVEELIFELYEFLAQR